MVLPRKSRLQNCLSSSALENKDLLVLIHEARGRVAVPKSDFMYVFWVELPHLTSDIAFCYNNPTGVWGTEFC